VLCAVIAPQRTILALTRFIIRIVYKLKIIGLENIPKDGGAILVCNHVSYLDPLILSASMNRPVRFLVYDAIYNTWFVKPIAKAVKAIPIPAKCNRDSVRALDMAADAVKNGELVVIFAEGHVQRVGTMLSFTTGFNRIRRESNAPIIPVYIDRVWGTNWVFFEGKFHCNMPKELPYPMTVAFGEPIKEECSAYKIRRIVQELGADVAPYKKEVFQVLHLAFLRTAKRAPFRKAMANATGRSLNYMQVLGMSLLSAKILKQTIPPSESKFVGIMLPPSVEAVLINIALYFIGKIPVNLNYTASDKFLLSVEKQTGMQTIVTSKKFLEKLNKQALPSMLFLEDLLGGLSTWEKLKHVSIALLMPQFLIKKLYLTEKPSRYDLATLVFSSGSTGEPKGVMLSHDNIASDIESFLASLHIGRKDTLIGILPFFHSFGFTVCLWLPLLSGAKVVYHFSPFDASTIGQAMEDHKVTLIVGTPTFFAAYTKKCTKEQFSYLRLAIAGAEKLKKGVAVDFYDKFGINIHEGYGCTELSPVVSVNLKDVSGYWKGQLGYKEGTVGRPMPQIAAKILDVDTGEELEANQEGLLYIKGSNVMMGYLGREDLTREVMKDSWYCTGDIAMCDDEGFIKITDRLSRFSKIAGEMVPHIKAEELFHELLDKSERVCVVTGVPDGKRGERLVVLHLLDEIDPRHLSKLMSEHGLPNLWIPKPEDYYRVEEMPLLGSGKLDLRKAKQMALELASQKKASA
jgi:acyl-[acyl-carrier-protein]-phospholipid O-acyltransferase/long-chain-fatty-acid--[acyl-carrier-protein] ligase